MNRYTDTMIRRAAAGGTVDYLDRHGIARTGALVHWPRRSGRAKVRTTAGRYVTVPPGAIIGPAELVELRHHVDLELELRTVIAGVVRAWLNPQPPVEPQPSTLHPRSRVSVHDIGPDGTLPARDVGAPPRAGSR